MVLRLPHANAPLSGNVLVLGDNDLAALAIVRSLGRASLRVHLCGMRSPADHPAVSVCTSDSEVQESKRESTRLSRILVT
jgi:hypothetical protein